MSPRYYSVSSSSEECIELLPPRPNWAAIDAINPNEGTAEAEVVTSSTPPITFHPSNTSQPSSNGTGITLSSMNTDRSYLRGSNQSPKSRPPISAKKSLRTATSSSADESDNEDRMLYGGLVDLEVKGKYLQSSVSIQMASKGAVDDNKFGFSSSKVNSSPSLASPGPPSAIVAFQSGQIYDPYTPQKSSWSTPSTGHGVSKASVALEWYTCFDASEVTDSEEDGVGAYDAISLKNPPSNQKSKRLDPSISPFNNTSKQSVPKLEVFAGYVIFFLLGATSLLPWSVESVSGTYFETRLKGSPLSSASMNWVSLTYTLGHLIFLALATVTQRGANLARRIVISNLGVAVLLALGIISTRIEEIETNLFFALLIGWTVLMSVCASYMQYGVVALSTRFGKLYLQGIVSGQGGVGLAAALVQFVSAVSAEVTALPAAASRTSAFNFFLAVTIYSGLTLLAYLFLTRLPLYHLVLQPSKVASQSYRDKSSGPSIRVVERKIRKLGLSMFWIFCVTFTVFPSITASILSVASGGGGKSAVLGAFLSKPPLFVPLGFVIYNAGDVLGRALTHFHFLVYTDWRLLMGASLLRTVFIPLFLLCNAHLGGSSTTPIFNSDIVFIFIMILFSISNGYISTLIMLAALIDPSLGLAPEEDDVATTCLEFYLTAGLAAGSFLSFAIKAVACRCNSFA